MPPRKLPLHPAHPERICWGCDKYCAADDLRCGNGTDRTQHPAEIFGDDWLEHGLDAEPAAGAAAAPTARPAVAPVAGATAEPPKTASASTPASAGTAPARGA